jgi:hypothetical protein
MCICEHVILSAPRALSMARKQFRKPTHNLGFSSCGSPSPALRSGDNYFSPNYDKITIRARLKTSDSEFPPHRPHWQVYCSWYRLQSWLFGFNVGIVDPVSSGLVSGNFLKLINPNRNATTTRPSHSGSSFPTVSDSPTTTTRRICSHPSPSPTQGLDEISMYASRQYEHRRVFHFLGDHRPSLLNLINDALIFSRSDKHAREYSF